MGQTGHSSARFKHAASLLPALTWESGSDAHQVREGSIGGSICRAYTLFISCVYFVYICLSLFIFVCTFECNPMHPSPTQPFFSKKHAFLLCHHGTASVETPENFDLGPCSRGRRHPIKGRELATSSLKRKGIDLLRSCRM